MDTKMERMSYVGVDKRASSQLVAYVYINELMAGS